jgi:hypothetical protein
MRIATAHRGRDRRRNSRCFRSALQKALPIVAITAAAAGALAFQRPNDPQALSMCQSGLKQFALGMMMYLQDYDERFPPMRFPAQVQNRVLPYVKNRDVFSCPATGTDYLPNPALNYVALTAIKAPADVTMLRDAKPHTTDAEKPAWNVAYADGHVRLSLREPPLGKPAPTPTHAETVHSELQTLRKERRELDARIRTLEAEERRLRRRR